MQGKFKLEITVATTGTTRFILKQDRKIVFQFKYFG